MAPNHSQQACSLDAVMPNCCLASEPKEIELIPMRTSVCGDSCAGLGFCRWPHLPLDLVTDLRRKHFDYLGANTAFVHARV